MKNLQWLMLPVQIFFGAAGFFAVLNGARSVSVTFNFMLNIMLASVIRFLDPGIMPDSVIRFFDLWFFGRYPSIVLFALCVIAFAVATWFSKPLFMFRKADFSVILLFCGAGIFACYFMMRDAVFNAPTIFVGGGHFGFDSDPRFILVPLAAYVLGLFALSELIFRIRDKTIVSTLYWFAFFKNFRFLYVKILAGALLAVQILLLVSYFNLPVRVFALVTIAALTYFAAFLLNLSREYDLANAEKIRAERFKSELITNVSHDIRTPLTSIINYTDLLKTQNLQGEAAEYLQVLDKKSARLKVLIDDLMEASKAGTGNLPVEITEIDLGEIVGQVAGEFAFSDLSLVIRAPDEPVKIRFDSRHLHRILENFFSNAEKYSLAGTRVFAEISQADGNTTFTMQNTARDPMELSGRDVTARFMRGDKSRNTEGNGLGLYIAKSLTELCGAKMRVDVIGDMFCVSVRIRSSK
ncbi:MAG: HAMP domain-containing histidine kinase [Defluviitaleaceae bacterium]|nr:HAMP domain-containing histidine kinase [Defluviitaleaceae bacterium]